MQRGQPLLAFLFGFVGLIPSGLLFANAQAYDYGLDIISLTRRRSSSSLIIVSKLPPSTNGTTPARPEIRQMKADAYKWDLFILALSMFQYVSQDDPTSWYQIAGIHGVPFTTWNGVEPAPGASQSGYCTHSSVLFPVWHRPYLALYEQEMYRMVNIIANLFRNSTEKQKYRTAAQDFRIPYWDWATSAPEGETHFPRVFWDPVIPQYGPNGLQYIQNPLYSYQFDPLDEAAMVWRPLKYWHETKRAPDTSVSETSPPSNNSVINEALLAKLPEIQQRLYILFAAYHDWNPFSNKAWADERNASGFDSIEAIHDVIHIYGGYRGHMTYVPLSAFDPLFFLHHAMTDRLVAMWQTLNPTAWIEPMASGETSYNSLQGSIQDASSPLTPFYSNSEGVFWTSELSRTTEAFGYTYKDIPGTLTKRSGRRERLSGRITELYGGHSLASLLNQTHPSRPADTGESWKLKSTHDTFYADVKPQSLELPADSLVQGGTYREWIINVKVNAEALDGRFDVHFFLGRFPESVKDWTKAPSHVGSVDILAMNKTTGSQRQVCGTLPLTSALIRLISTGKVASLQEDHVGPFLRSMLQYGVMDSKGDAVPSHHVEGLAVSVTCATVTLPADDVSLPRFGPARILLEL